MRINNWKNGSTAFEYSLWFGMSLFMVASMLAVFCDECTIDNLVDLSG